VPALHRQPARTDPAAPASPSADILTPEQGDALRALGYVYLRTGQTHKALDLFEALHHLFPGEHSIALSLAYSRLASGRREAALSLAEALLTENPAAGPTAALHLLCARALLSLGRPAEARRHLLRHREIKNTPP
jgi:hypothetical protein